MGLDCGARGLQAVCFTRPRFGLGLTAYGTPAGRLLADGGERSGCFPFLAPVWLRSLAGAPALAVKPLRLRLRGGNRQVRPLGAPVRIRLRLRRLMVKRRGLHEVVG
jgi:hypothetical protein